MNRSNKRMPGLYPESGRPVSSGEAGRQLPSTDQDGVNQGNSDQMNQELTCKQSVTSHPAATLP